MKCLRTIVLFDKGGIGSSSGFQSVHQSYVRSIIAIDHPSKSGQLTLRRKELRPDGQWDRNGVVYLKKRFLAHMVQVEGWLPEGGFKLGAGQMRVPVRLYPGLGRSHEPVTSNFGGIDFVTTTDDGLHVGIEWETGNVSSSHRSMNKLAIALDAGTLQAAVLIVPSRDLYDHLTDRVGNIGELSGYLSMWQKLGTRVTRGLLAITVVEQDALTDDPAFPYLPVGEDGRAKQGKAKRR